MMTERTKSMSYTQKRIAEVDKKNAELVSKFSKLQNILNDALSQDAYIDLDSRKKSARIIPFKNKPKLENYLPSSRSGLDNLPSSERREYVQLCAEGEKRYLQDKTKFETRIKSWRKKVNKRNQRNVDLKQDFANGKPGTVKRYFNRVLHASDYPSSFPKNYLLKYESGSRPLSVEYELPYINVVPEVKDYRYDKELDAITQTALPQSERAQLGASVFAQIVLRTIHEIFQADRTEMVDTILFNGCVKAPDSNTGRLVRFYLTSFSITRRQFLDINLHLVDPVECLTDLNMNFSAN